jgi:hypothetical protein
LLCREGRKAAGEEHGDAMPDGAPVEREAAAPLVEREDGDEGGEHVGDGVDAGEPGGFIIGEAGLSEDGRLVHRDGGDPDPFLDDLEPDDQLDAARDVLSF